MPVELLISDVKYLNQFKNDELYASSTTDYTVNLAANVMENIKHTSTIDVSWYALSSSSQPFDFESVSGLIYRLRKSNGGTFIGNSGDGFSIGDTVDIILSAANPTLYTVTITNVTTTWIYITFTVPPTTTATQLTTCSMYGKSSLTAFIYSFGLIENNEDFNTISKVSGNNQEYYASDLVVGVPQTMTPRGVYRDWVSGSVTIEKIANPSTYVQRYYLTHILTVNPYYLDGEISYLQSGLVRPLYAGNSALKHVINCEFLTGLTNPNSSKIQLMDYILGSIGDFGENMNGFNSDYSIVSKTYEDSLGNSADGLLTSQQTTVRIKVAKTSGAFISTDRLGAYVSYLPTVSEYVDTATDFDANFIKDSLYCLAGGVPVAGAGIIDEVTATLNAGDIDLIVKVTYTTAQQIYIAGNPSPNFLIAVQVGDITKTNPNSDRVMLVVDALPYDNNPDISGLFTMNSFRYFSHDMTVGVDAGFTSLSGWNEDGFTTTFDFDLDLNKSALLNTLTASLVAINTTTNDYFELDSYTFQLGNIISSGVQQLNISDTRGYTLSTGSQFNEVTLVTGALVAGFQNYTGTFSQKISWQEWLQNIDVDQIFYNSTQPNNNLNFKASNYSALNGYEISIIFKANCYGIDTTLGVSGLTDYLFKSNPITVYDYDLDMNVTPEWSSTIQTFNSLGVDLNGAILTNGEDTTVVTTFANSVAPIYTITNFWAIHRIEPQNNLGYSIEELSSISTYPTGQLPIPLPPATLLDIQTVAGDVVTTSLIDGSVLDPNESYKLSSRLQSPNLAAPKVTWTFKTNSFTPDTFDPSVVNIGTTAIWNFGDSVAITTADSVSHVYTVAGVKYVTMGVDNYTDITAIDVNTDNIYKDIDISQFTALTSFIATNNIFLSSISLPTTKK